MFVLFVVFVCLPAFLIGNYFHLSLISLPSLVYFSLCFSHSLSVWLFFCPVFICSRSQRLCLLLPVFLVPAWVVDQFSLCFSVVLDSLQFLLPCYQLCIIKALVSFLLPACFCVLHLDASLNSSNLAFLLVIHFFTLWC